MSLAMGDWGQSGACCMNGRLMSAGSQGWQPPGERRLGFVWSHPSPACVILSLGAGGSLGSFAPAPLLAPSGVR
ncbi:hypothetical protein XENTR_v10006386 [Xenopus tropicalis]|nr:hypothetical protein XENTR_v10006386 [Xenopus tropicalis]